jgi:hypothetical protein
MCRLVVQAWAWSRKEEVKYIDEIEYDGRINVG